MLKTRIEASSGSVVGGVRVDLAPSSARSTSGGVLSSSTRSNPKPSTSPEALQLTLERRFLVR